VAEEGREGDDEEDADGDEPAELEALCRCQHSVLNKSKETHSCNHFVTGVNAWTIWWW
jgi:hypothetical protein